MFQSTRPRGARQGHRYLRDHPGAVSIHAPAWGATDPTGGVQLARHVSIHAPAWGATGSRSHLPQQSLRRFNPRARVGRDAAGSGGMGSRRGFQSTRPRGARPGHASGPAAPGHVSIHAPAWGATHTVFAVLGQFQVSIHAPAWGATCDLLRFLLALASVSIHAPAWGATRPNGSGFQSPRRCFNPRARVGRDHCTRNKNAAICNVSIHAPAWGATGDHQRSARFASLFQSTRPRGARPRARARGLACRPVSIHAPAWGATRWRRYAGTSRTKFQSTRPRGARRRLLDVTGGATTFQSTRPRGARRWPNPASWTC